MKRQKLDGTKIEKDEKLKKEKEQELWSRLHADLWRKIISNFCFIDQVRFHAVCKNWKAVDEYNKTPFSLPWVITIETPKRFTKNLSFTKNLIYKIYEPVSSHMEKTIDKTLDFKKYGLNPCSPWFLQSNFTCKYGWLFFSMEDRYIQPRVRFLLISLITKEFIEELPEIKLPQMAILKDSYPKFIKGFSMQPKSRDCLFFVLNYNFSKTTFTIYTFRKGEKGWTSRDYYKPAFCEVFSLDACSVLYSHGTLYIAFPDERVVLYYIDKGMFRVASYSNFDINIPDLKTYQVFECDGELLLIYIRHNGSGTIRKFDMHDKLWCPLKSLGDRALFVSSHTSWFSTVGDEARNYGVLPNNVYYLNEGRCKVYTLASNDDNLVESTDASEIIYCSRFNNLEGDLVFWLKHPGLVCS